MFAEMWGFEAVFESAHTGIVRDMVRIKLTQNLSTSRCKTLIEAEC